MKRPTYSRIVSILLCLALVIALVPPVPLTLGAVSDWDPVNRVYTIHDFVSLIGAAEFSITETGCKPGVTYRMTEDVAIGEDFLTDLKNYGIDHLTFGDKDHYFQGVFDGQGHTISGLNYANNLFKVATRTGLFSFTRGATIKDLTIKHADMHADMITGILVGEAYNTHFENVTIDSSAVSVNPADNTLVLITDGGVIGGGMVGFANGCSFYNCQVSNTSVRVNSVSGVAALSGKGLYLGGLVGAMQYSTLEYSRVLGGKVSNRYESSVGALGGFTLYSGGLVGYMEQQSKVVDCFATCDVSFHAATYVGVGAGCSGNVGGLVARVKDKSCQLTRCHYADGTLSSFQYNTLLLFIPVQVDHDIYISGLVEEFEGDRALVKDCFFNEQDTLGPSWGEKPDVLHNNKTSPSYGPQPDERYMDRAFWESHGYDFTGTVDRSVENFTSPFPHTNKWVMYYYEDPVVDKKGNPVKDEEGNPVTVRRGYPVHGQSVAATFDFPGAGSVTLKAASDPAVTLSDAAETTADPYKFAVLGFYPTETLVTDYDDGHKEGGVDLSIALNEGYRLVNWYLEPSVTAAGLPTGQHGYFERIFAQEDKKTTLVEENHNLEVEDNQLYVAYCQALVEFHDLTGDTLNTSGVPDGNLTDDYYDYAASLPDVVPQQNSPEGENVKLIGWTTRKHTAEEPGWRSVTTSDLKNLREDGVFYLPGDPILETLQLYPVYADQLLNIHTQIEGYDSDADVTLRAGVGQTHVRMEGGRIVLHVQSLADPENPSDAADFPDGYRFLGWYEDGLCVSRERDYALPDTVDLNVEHVYEARFTYRVRYYATSGHYDGNDTYHPFNKPYVTHWELYNAPFDNTVQMPIDFHFVFESWHEGMPPGQEDTGCGAALVPADKLITAPYDVHDHLTRPSGGVGYDVFVTTDFPGSAGLQQWGKGDTAGDGSVHVQVFPNSNYNFLFWLANGHKYGDWYRGSAVNPWSINERGYLAVGLNHGVVAHMTANAIFHTKDGAEKATVQRRYQENLFLGTDTAHAYKYPFNERPLDLTETSHIGTITTANNPPSEAFPFDTDMTVKGYYFIGWLDRDDPDTQNAWDTIYNVPDDPCTTTNVELAQQYVLKGDATVTRAMPSLYPVYAKYDVKTTTNVFLEIKGELNKPADPTYTLADDTAPVTTVTVTAHNHVAVHDHLAEGESQEYYDLEAVTLSIDGGEPVTLATEADHTGNGDWTLTYEVHPGKHYLFTAVYKPYVVVYHVNGDVGPKVLLRNYGDAIAQSYLPEIQDSVHELDCALFVGWTETEPENGLYHYFPESVEGKSSYDQAKEFGFWTLTQTEDTLVTHSMELWPVFATYTVKVDSNIDQELVKSGEYTEDTLGQVRSLERLTANTISTTVKAAEVEGYKFMGWYTDAKQEDGSYDFTSAKAISESEEYTLQNEEPFADKLYTARYQRVYKVVYHRPDGVEYFTDYLFEGQDEGKQLNTTVTEETEITNPDGTVSKQEVTYQKPLNAEPYFEMYQLLEKNQVFGQWYRYNAASTQADKWEPIYKFDQMPIIPTEGKDSLLDNTHRELHLYPSIWTTNVYDSKGQEITPDNGILSTLTGMSQDQTTGDISAWVDVRFDPQKPYTQNKLTVHVERLIWTTSDGGVTVTPQPEDRPGVHVTLLPDATKPHGDLNATPLAEKDTGTDGDAVFTWENGLLRIVKTVPMETGPDAVFLFQVTQVEDPANTRRVAVICDQPYYGEVTEDTQVGWYGRARLYLPVGTYRVEEVADWSSQYTPTYQVLTGEDVPITGTVTEDPDTGEKTYEFTHLNVPVTLTNLPGAKTNCDPVRPIQAVYTEVLCKNAKKEDAPSWLTASVGKENLFNTTP